MLDVVSLFLLDECIESASKLQIQVTVVDVSTSQKEVEAFTDFNFVSRNTLLSYFSKSGVQSPASLPDDRGKALDIMGEAVSNFLQKALDDCVLAGVIGLGGSGGTSLLSRGFRSLPVGIPKVIVSTVASGQTEAYIGTSDLVLFPSIVDICGINNVSRTILSNAGAAFAGMVMGSIQASSSIKSDKFTVGITMFGVTTPCVNAVKERLAKHDFEPLVFHATGVGGRAMEDLVKAGLIQVFFCSSI